MILTPVIPLRILLLYRKKAQPTPGFLEALSYISASMDIDIVVGDFNLKPDIQLTNALSQYEQLVLEATHIGGSILDHAYVKKSLLGHFSIIVNVESIFFSDHETVRIAIQKNYSRKFIVF